MGVMGLSNEILLLAGAGIIFVVIILMYGE
jgi:hypothetical protein